MRLQPRRPQPPLRSAGSRAGSVQRFSIHRRTGSPPHLPDPPDSAWRQPTRVAPGCCSTRPRFGIEPALNTTPFNDVFVFLSIRLCLTDRICRPLVSLATLRRRSSSPYSIEYWSSSLLAGLPNPLRGPANRSVRQSLGTTGRAGPEFVRKAIEHGHSMKAFVRRTERLKP